MKRLPAILAVLGCICFFCLWLGTVGQEGPISHAAEPKEGKSGGKTSKLPPLVVDKSAPLMLEEPSKKKDESFLTINQACFVCHNNYREEYLMRVHAKQEIACMECHGESIAHRNDEDNITPPDIMYPLDKINEACQECHDTHDAPAKKVVARWRERCPQKTDVGKIVCTDCHGKHRLESRTVRWDKRTGKLILSAGATSKAKGRDSKPESQQE